MSSADMTGRAGDYVLGLLEETERKAAEREISTDPAFAAEVQALEERLGALDDRLMEEPAPSHLWSRIASQIDAEALDDADPADAQRSSVAGFGINPTNRHGALGLRRPLAHHFKGFRATALAASILAACGLGYVVGQASMSQSDPEVVVLLADEQNEIGAFVEAYGDDRVRIVPLVNFDVPQGKVLEVWTLYDRDVGPVSLGTLDQGREALLSGPAQPEPQPQQLYEITLEDAPRSSAGRPLGPILVKGLAVAPPR